MKAFRISVINNDYPYLVVAENVCEAVVKLETQTSNSAIHVKEDDITGITVLQEFEDHRIIV